MKNCFDKDYFEDGLVAAKSCYVNYRWMPELTIKMGYNLIKHLRIKEGESILDFGCAKGFLVKALRVLDVDAYGCDISEYAIDNVDSETRPYCKLIEGVEGNMMPFDKKFDWIISKDVLEHVPEETIDIFLEQAIKKTDKMFHVIPLADNDGKFIIPEYDMDKTHILRKNLNWWIEKFKSKGWNSVSFDYNVRGIKDNWTSKYEQGNAFFIVKKE